MNSSKEQRQFLDLAASKGASSETIVALLRGRGWPEEDAFRALADHYETSSGLAIPAYRRSASAKDAFFYLLSLIALGTWTIGIGSLSFSLIDRWIPDSLGHRTVLTGTLDEIAGALASVIVAFPVYVLLMNYILRHIEVHPEKLESRLRKWLIYGALLVAASVVLGDLITFLTYFLEGDLTSRFLAKIAVVLVIAAGVFWYYFQAAKAQVPAETRP